MQNIYSGKNECTNLFVSNVFQCVGDNGDTHVDKIRGGHFKHLFAELFPIFVDFLNRKGKYYYLNKANPHETKFEVK